MLADSSKLGVWRYEKLLPPVAEERQISLGEGRTPLVKSVGIARALGLNNLYFKIESGNPTGSYKDRIAAVGVSWALQQGKTACIGTTSGNAGASVAAYAARAGIPYHLYVLEHIVEAKLLQVVAHGANVTKVKGFGESIAVGDGVFAHIKRQAERMNWESMITAYKFNAVAMEGVKTIAYELYDDWNEAVPDAVFVPVGGGGLFTGIRKGFEDIHRLNGTAVPSMVAVQSEGCDNIVRGWKQGSETAAGGDSTSQISGLQVPNPPDGDDVLRVLNAGEGWAEAVPDTETWFWQEQLADKEGILCEPAAAISVAGAAKALKEGRIGPETSVVCVLSGAGYKDAGRLQAIVKSKPAVPLKSVEELG
ncbi:threonine synthase [Paenibacillus sp. MBLB4367]|uniref:threonine synthase n=1 Tax=Paenibacillus sp. MBLB4367 TaxID=3384767 RepID=UPI00390818C5